MSESERKFRVGLGVCGMLFCGAVVLLSGCDVRAQETRPTKFDLIVYTDNVTGCQYVTESRGLTPRIAEDGHSHMGCKGAKP